MMGIDEADSHITHRLDDDERIFHLRTAPKLSKLPEPPHIAESVKRV